MGRLPYFIAKRYLLAKHSRHAVGLLSRIAIGAVAVATFSLFLVLSGFTGLKAIMNCYNYLIFPHTQNSRFFGVLLRCCYIQ